MKRWYKEQLNIFNGKLAYRAMFLFVRPIGYLEAHRFVQTIYFIK
jgi:hypothetical protein